MRRYYYFCCGCAFPPFPRLTLFVGTACTKLKWKAPTDIQRESVPVALQGRDIIGLAKTGSGKTGAFVLPILQALLENPQPLFALIMAPTRYVCKVRNWD